MLVMKPHEDGLTGSRLDDDGDSLRHRALLLHVGPGPIAAWWVEVKNHEDLDANPLRWSDEVYRIFGYEPREVEASNALFFQHVHPDDRQRVRDAVQHALVERRPYSIEHRIVRRDGSERTVIERGDARFDSYGRPVTLYGTVQYATAQVRALEALRLSEDEARRQLAEIESLYATAPIGLCVFDRQLRWVRLNQQIADINGVPVADHIGKTPREVVPDIGEQAEAALRKILETGEPLVDFEMSGTTAAQPGVKRFWNERWAPIRRADGEIIGITVAAEEITARKLEQQRIESLARFPEENPNPVIRVTLDAHVVYANPAALEAPLGIAVGARLPPALTDAVSAAVREGRRVRSEAEIGHSVFSLDAVPTTDEVSVYALDVTPLRKAQKRLRQANSRKDEFIATLSHELRNPLAPMLNAANVLERADPASQQAIRACAVVKRQAEHLARLVDDLLDVTRIAKGRVDVRRSRIDLSDVVRRCGDDLRLAFHQRGVTLRTFASESVWADADPTRIEQLVSNLLHNAAKFTKRGDEVTLSLHPHRDRAEIRVRDTGAGIDAAVLPHVFEKYVQGRRTLGMSKTGLGLGLALVKGIAELHGGTVRAESRGKDQGAEFIVALPVVSAPTHRAPQPAPRRVDAGRRILLIDDNVDNAQTLADLVELLGHAVEVAHDGRTGLEKAQANPPDVVLCDIALPDMTGYDVARALRAMSTCEARLVALSGHAQPEDVQTALEAGFDAHVAKPCELRQIEVELALGCESGRAASRERGREEVGAARPPESYLAMGRDGP